MRVFNLYNRPYTPNGNSQSMIVVYEVTPQAATPVEVYHCDSSYPKMIRTLTEQGAVMISQNSMTASEFNSTLKQFKMSGQVEVEMAH
jgi:hypothetical protein